jgi:parallel beta-helix repeat protein
MRRSSVIFCAVCLISLGTSPSTALATSVYAITYHQSSDVRVYDIEDDQIELQLNCDYFPDYGTGAVDLAISSDNDMLFASYDGPAIITLYNAKTMESNGYVNPPREIAGIYFDEVNQRLLAVEREGQDLYIYDYNSETDSLIYNKTINLMFIDDAYGMCLDEVDQYLYVSDSTNIVRYYDASNPNFPYLGDIEIEVGMQEYEAVGIDIYNDDQGNKYLYTGAWTHSGSHEYLIRIDLSINDPNDPDYIIAKNIQTNVLGVAVNHDEAYNGLVYITTYRYGGSVEVYDTSNWANDPNEYAYPTDYETDGVSGPAGLVVGSQYKTDSIDITKVDDVGTGDPNSPEYRTCVSPPDDLITYKICILPEADPNEYYNVVVTDHLPDEVYFVSADPNNGEYDEFNHTYTWYLGYVPGYNPADPGDPNVCMTLTVKVNEGAEPMGVIENIVEVESDKAYNIAKEYTPVCCWGGDIIYVDQRATGYNTGTCWDDAYISLQSALNRAEKGCGNEIWVARGVYEPGSSAVNTFDLIDDVEVYGGFIGNETAKDQRNFVQNKTFLSGDDVCSIVITADNVSSATILDGFIIQAGTSNGIYCYYGDPIIANCVVMENGDIGIRCRYNSEPAISDCVVKDNDDDGVEFYGSGSPVIERSKIYNNVGYGIYAQSSSPVITNNWIHHNDEGGIYLYSAAANIRNNTIVYNHNVGVKRFSGTAPIIVNCILWENQDDLDGCTATYSCIQDSDNGDGNIDSNPIFAYEDPNTSYNYHLDPESPCIDAGNDSAVTQDETDIDGDERIYDWIPSTTYNVDMGADEVACDDVSNSVDWNADGIVNLFEYADLANAWLSIDPDYTTDPNYSENWNPLCDLNDDHYIDLVDLYYLCDNWLWQACWLNTETWMMMSMGQGGGVGRDIATEPLSESEMEAAKLRKWRINRPPYVMNLQEEVWLLEDILSWAETIWYTDKNLRKEIDEKEWFEFVNSIKEMLKEKVTLLLSTPDDKKPDSG